MTNIQYLEHLGVDTTWLRAVESQSIAEGKQDMNTISATDTEVVTQSVVIKCILVSDAPLSAEASALTEKMMSAIGIFPTEYIVVQSSIGAEYQIAFFLDKQMYQAHPNAKHFYLTHPEHIVTHPELKREAWETLKRAKLLLNG